MSHHYQQQQQQHTNIREASNGPTPHHLVRCPCHKTAERCPLCEGHELCISFAAAGWLQMYLFGVAKAVQDMNIHNENVFYSGSSAGALTSAALVTECDFDQVRAYARACAIDCRSNILKAFMLRKYVTDGIDRFATSLCQSQAVLDALTSQLEINVSVLPWCRRHPIREYTSAEDLEEALVASCCITPLAGFPFRLKKTGEWVCDGGMTAFQPRKGQPGVITVSPIYFTSADIKPSAFIPIWWGLYPPDDKQYDALFDLGYNDAIEFFIRKKLVAPSCVHLMKKEPLKPPRGALTIVQDFLTVVFFLCFFRPFTIALIYIEMFSVIVLLLGKALSIAIFHPFDGDHRQAWADFYNSFRNIISFRVLAHVYLGSSVPINERRLQRFSRLYRVVKPFL